MAEINIIPLVDVMLVLLVIFIVTAPLLTHAVKIDLPKVSSRVDVQPERIELAIDGTGQVFWNGEKVDEASLPARMQAAGQRQPQPELQFRADRATRYDRIAAVMGSAARAGLGKFAFVTLPAP